MITSHLGRLAAGQDLSQPQMEEIIDLLLQGSVPENEMAVLLTALHHKGETADEIAGAARTMRRHMTPLHTTRRTCWIPAAPAASAASCSISARPQRSSLRPPACRVAKHGNRSVTSKSGSSDVLAALGVNVEAPLRVVERCLDELGICFCFAPRFHPAMKHVAAVRKKLGFATIFNLLGPLCNPAGARPASGGWQAGAAANDGGRARPPRHRAGRRRAWYRWPRRDLASARGPRRSKSPARPKLFRLAARRFWNCHGAKRFTPHRGPRRQRGADSPHSGRRARPAARHCRAQCSGRAMDGGH